MSCFPTLKLEIIKIYYYHYYDVQHCKGLFFIHMNVRHCLLFVFLLKFEMSTWEVISSTYTN